MQHATLADDTRADERHAERRAYRNEAAAKRRREQIIIDHMGLAGSVAYRYRRVDGADMGDLRAAALLGLTEAAATYDEGRGVKLTTWAWSRIQNAIREYIRTIAPVALPQHIDELGARVHRLETEALLLTGELPTDEVLAVAVGSTAANVHAVRNRPTGTTFDTAAVRSETLTVADVLEAPSTCVSERAETAELRAALTAEVDRLTPQQRKAILSYARTGSKTATALEMGVSKQTAGKRIAAAQQTITARRPSLITEL